MFEGVDLVQIATPVVAVKQGALGDVVEVVVFQLVVAGAVDVEGQAALFGHVVVEPAHFRVVVVVRGRVAAAVVIAVGPCGVGDVGLGKVLEIS